MDPQLEKTPGFALPNPASAQGLPNNMPAKIVPSHTENAYQQPQQSVQAAAVPMTNIPGAASVTAVDPVAAATIASSNDDNDSALDEEWVDKAKTIVEQTRHDPHLESIELGKVKADFLRIRYNKHIKIAEDKK